jgi:peptidoglycan LD-endopeptidase LytH
MRRIFSPAGRVFFSVFLLFALPALSADPHGAVGLVPPQPQPGPLLIPVAGVDASRLFDTFSQSRGGGRPHEAIDIAAPKGTPVVAVDDGKVVKLFYSKPGGLTVYQFDTAQKLAYYYAHLDRYAPGLAEKQEVKRGDLLGYVGSTGNADPAAPHLHFAIFVLGPDKRWWQGTAINPYPFFAGR